ncbi:hypothetical protein JK364_13920 [Streptomyces sp. 110]|uniref:Uncharacterized protein n=1 Tax=Streptomyces endocoffeicus TaxID=2898945 RepID=A0ABS1PM24_9ACTN|nr:hypothetical protein [Streptomyces endocoffeicus]MBL1113481.1 hypothetical protein [Streptomyces endocoffeicus]
MSTEGWMPSLRDWMPRAASSLWARTAARGMWTYGTSRPVARLMAAKAAMSDSAMNCWRVSGL